ncbi:MAG TPA: Gldg family protein [Polyangiaceae bacterium]
MSGGANREGAPAWVVPLYVGGLVIVYLGERVLATFESGHMAATGLGVALVLVATAARFVPTWQAGGERGRIEKLLGLLSAVGVVALVVYAGSTDWGMAKLGLLTAPDEKRKQVHALLTLAWVVLVCLSVIPMLFAEASLYPMRNAERLESRRVRAAAAAGLTLALALVYGALFVYSAAGSDVKVDFSYFKTSEPSASTKKLIEGLNQPIRVVGFFPEVSPVRYEVEGYLKKLAAGTKNLKVEVVDRYLSPQLAKEMKIVQDGVIVIQKGEAKRMVTIGTEMKEAAKNLKTLDRDFQERVYKLLRERRTLYLTTGHGEVNDESVAAPSGDKQEAGRSAQILRTLLGKQNYNVKDLGLSQGLATDVPNDADVVMVLGPTQPFAPEELSAMSRYAKHGGKLFLALDPDAVSAEDVDSEEAGGTAADKSKKGEGDKAAPKKPSDAPKGPDAKKGAEETKAGEKAAPKKDGDKAPDSKKDGDKAADAAKTAAVAAAVSPGKGTIGTLQALAEIAGVEFSPLVLANDKQFARRRYNDSDKTLLVTNRFSSHASVSTLSRNAARAAVLVAGAGSVQRVTGGAAKVDIAVRAMANTFGDANRNYQFDEGTEKRDSFGLAAAVTLPVDGAPSAPPVKQDEKKDPKDIPVVAPPNEMRAFVLADADVLTDLVMSNFMTNQLLVIDALRWLGGEESFAGEVNTEEDVRIEHTQQKDLVWFYGTIFGAPALVLGLGLAYSRKSRRPKARGTAGGKK